MVIKEKKYLKNRKQFFLAKRCSTCPVLIFQTQNKQLILNFSPVVVCVQIVDLFERSFSSKNCSQDYFFFQNAYFFKVHYNMFIWIWFIFTMSKCFDYGTSQFRSLRNFTVHSSVVTKHCYCEDGDEHSINIVKLCEEWDNIRNR